MFQICYREFYDYTVLNAVQNTTQDLISVNLNKFSKNKIRWVYSGLSEFAKWSSFIEIQKKAATRAPSNNFLQ